MDESEDAASLLLNKVVWWTLIMPISRNLLAVTCILSWSCVALAEPVPPGLMVQDGVLLKDGQPYRGVGANYFDLFLRILHQPGATSSLQGLKVLADAGIPFVRLGGNFSHADWKIYLNDREEYFRRMDRVVREAERVKVGLIPSLFPLDTIGIHLYSDHPVEKEMAAWARTSEEHLSAVRALADRQKRPIFIGEFGLSSRTFNDPAKTRAGFASLLAAMEKANVDLAAFWVFDLESQRETWNVTPDNERSFMIKLTAEANRRWNQQTHGKIP